MKDKLVKSGHRKYYYSFRRLGKMMFVVAALAVSASVPVLIAYGVSVKETLAEEAPKVEESSADATVEVSSYIGA